MNTLKTQICDALAAFIRQRPGLDSNDYFNPEDLQRGRVETYKRGVAAYRTAQRHLARDKRDAETLLQAVRGRDSITADMILEASKHAFSGRLTIEATPVRDKKYAAEFGSHSIKLDYCTGQYWPTEYRRAVAAVCASALWEHMRDNMPKPQLSAHAAEVYPLGDDWVNAGDWLRRNARREFGSKLQRRWFN